MWGCQLTASDSAQTSATTATYSKIIQQYKEFMTTRCNSCITSSYELVRTLCWYRLWYSIKSITLQSTPSKGIPSANAKNFYKNSLDSFFATRKVDLTSAQRQWMSIPLDRHCLIFIPNDTVFYLKFISELHYVPPQEAKRISRSLLFSYFILLLSTRGTTRRYSFRPFVFLYFTNENK